MNRFARFVRYDLCILARSLELVMGLERHEYVHLEFRGRNSVYIGTIVNQFFQSSSFNQRNLIICRNSL